MFDILLENHLRKRARLSKDPNFKHNIYDVNADALGDDVENIEQFIDRMAALYDPTYNPNNQNQGSEYLDYIIDNIKRGILKFDEQSQNTSRRLLQHYHEDQSSPKPLLSKELQRNYKDIVPTLQNALRDASVNDKAALINSPEFAEYYNKENSGAFGGQTQAQFFETLANLFDPSDDQRYMRYIIYNLTSGRTASGKERPANITKEESPFVKSMLQAHMQQVEAGNVKVKRDVMRFYPKIKFDLVNALSPYVEKFNTTTNISEALAQTKEFFERIGEPEYSNDSHLFYYLKTADEAKKVIRTRQAMDFGEVQRHCTEYWCLPAMSKYYPSWVTVDVYGFVDYAIVPKPSYNYSAGELKNRFNSTKTSLLMSDEDYESILDFMLNSESSKTVMGPLEKIANSRYNRMFNSDYGQFLLRSKNIETVNRLTNKNFADANEFIKWVFNVTPATVRDLSTFNSEILLPYAEFQRLCKPYKSKLPLFEQLLNKDEGDTSGTALDHAELLKTAFDDWMKKVQRFVNIFVKDKSASIVSEAHVNMFNELFSIYQVSTLRQLFSAKFNKVCDILADKVKDDTLRFEGRTSFAAVISLQTKLHDRSVMTENLAKTMLDALGIYLRTGGLQTIQFRGLTYHYCGDIEKIADMVGGNVSDNAKLNVIKSYLELFEQTANSVHASYNSKKGIMNNVLNSLKKVVSSFKIKEQDVALAVARAMEKKITDDAAQNKITDDATITSIYDAFRNSYDAKIRAYGKETPKFIKAVAVVDAKSKAHDIYPNALSMTIIRMTPSTRLLKMKKFAALQNLQFQVNDDTKVSGASVEHLVNLNTGMQSYMQLKTRKWNEIALFLSLAVSDGSTNRGGGEQSSSLSPEAFYRIRDSINDLIETYNAVPVAFNVNAYAMSSRNASEFIVRYSNAKAHLFSLNFLIQMKLQDGRIVCIDKTGYIYNALSINNIVKRDSASEFKNKMRNNVPANESKRIKVKNFNVLFERASVFGAKNNCNSTNVN